MPKTSFDSVFAAFAEYRAAQRRFVEAMRPLGIVTSNVEPLADFAEIVVAREFDGQLQPRANKDVDVVAADGTRIQVKSLRVSRDRPNDNWLNWYGCTRRKSVVGTELPLISADLLAIVVYLDSELYAMVTFPITAVEKFPVIEVKDLFMRHVDKLLATPAPEMSGVTVCHSRHLSDERL